ncbi:MAG: M23 family metallopeptidase [Bacteroidales bacterium]|nr:M23 family metallopeptidase [Bacteroidales bacterium]
MKKILLGILMIYALTNLSAQPKMVIPFEPQIFNGVNRTSLVYEIHLKDSLNRNIEIEEFKVQSKNTLLLFDSEFISYDFRVDTNRFIKNIWIDVDTLPAVITNILKCSIGGKEFVIEKEMTIKDRDLLMIRPPINEGSWFIAGGPGDSSYHRVFSQKIQSKYETALDGFILGYCNQRFAIDWIGTNDKGQFYKNDGRTNEDFYGYSKDIVAVADGEVIWIRDGIPDYIPPNYPDSIYAAETALGNCILLDIGDNIVAFYAHLKPESIRVRLGDKVKEGDIIGKLGNSGPSTGPHLHFDLRKRIIEPFTSGLNRYYAQSVAYVFNSYELIGTGIDDNEDGELEIIEKNIIIVNQKLPESNEIIISHGKNY